ncbi:PilW family protein [Patescibacteria group bacterium]
MKFYTKQKNKISNEGFTLIEMIVAVSLFTIVSLVAIGALISISNANRKVNSLRTTMDNINFAMESMSRDIRTGTNYLCEGVGNCSGGGDDLSFEDQSGVTITYRHNDTSKSIQVREGAGDFVNITSPEVRVENLTFYVVGVGTDNRQPRVLIVIEGTAGLQDKTISTFNLQSTVSQRNLDS